ncbi:MAG TPA: collagen-like protein, partial [Bryobacteraceae bacterium]
MTYVRKNITSWLNYMKVHQWTVTLILLAGGWRAAGQTGVDLSRQGKVGTGTELPVRCTVGQIFFKTDAPAGANLYACTTPNMWAPVGLPTLGGDASGSQPSVTVKGLQGRAVSSASPADQNVLRWNAATGQWDPGMAPATGVADPPEACTIGGLYLRNDPANDIHQLYVCSKTDTWTMASTRSGRSADRPNNCVLGQTWLSTDTGNMTYCSATGSPGTWSSTLAGPQGPTGPQGLIGPTGPQGQPGANGNTMLSGSAAPTAGVGANGDYYLNTTANCLYGPKASGAWPGTCTSLLGSPNFTFTSGNATTAGNVTALGLTQTAVEPSCNNAQLESGVISASQCKDAYLSGLFNPSDGGNLMGFYDRVWIRNGRNAADNSDKKTFLGHNRVSRFAGSGQRFGDSIDTSCTGVGDCYGLGVTVAAGAYGTAPGDENNGLIRTDLQQPAGLTVATTSAPIKSACAATRITAAITSKSSSPSDVKTVSVDSSAGCAAGDWLTIDQGKYETHAAGPAGDDKVETIHLTTAGSGTITALFQTTHAANAPVAPAVKLQLSSGYSTAWGQGRVVVDLTSTPVTGASASVPKGSSTVTGVGTNWTTGMVGGDANLPGCMAFNIDTTSVGPFASTPLVSWFPIQSVTDGTHLVLSRA